MRGLFNKAIGASLYAPFVPKNIDPFIIGAGISAAASIGSGVASGIQASNLSKENREYDWKKFEASQSYNTLEAERSRAHQKALLEREQAWNEEMYKLYNSPSALRAQFEEAGYHPYLVSPEHGVGSSSMQASSPSAPSSPQGSVSASGSPSTFLPDVASPMRGLIDSTNLLLTGKRVNAESANQQAQALSYIADLIPKLHSIGMSDDDIRKVVEPFLVSSQGINADNDLVFRTAKTKYLTDDANRQRQELELDLAKRFSPKERQAYLNSIDQNITESVAKIGLMASEAKLNEKECEHLAQDMVESLSRIYRNNAEGSKADIEGFQLMEFMPYVESELRRSANKAELEDEETFGNKGIRKFDKTIFGKGLNVLLWYLNRAFGSTNTGINVSAKIPSGK